MGVVGAAALLGTGLLATPASAHTPTWTVDCSTAKLDLTMYNGQYKNTVTVTADGKTLLPETTFGSDFHKVLDIPAHNSAVTVNLVVKAGDSDRYSVNQTKTSPVCPGQVSQSPTPSPSPTKPSTVAPTASQSASASASAVAPTAAGSNSPTGNLAETGSSSSTPIIAGVAGAVLLAGGGLVVVARKRRPAARH
jgi:LPXTG-motif cell wall-anchored protein